MRLILSLFLLAFSSSVMARELYYLKMESVDLSQVPPPPVPHSKEDLDDLQAVIFAQTARTQAECLRAAFESEGFATSFFGGDYGPLTTNEAKKLIEFQERLFNEVNAFSRLLKKKYSRVRPFERDTRVTPCIPLHHSSSYPSGHAATAYVASRAFALIYPDKTKEFFFRARTIAWGRVIGGVHHPLDVSAGEILGEKVFSALLENEDFLNDLGNLKP